MTCADLDCNRAAVHRLTYTGHDYLLCPDHADTGMEWLAAHRPGLARTAVMTPLAAAVEQPALFEETT